MKKKFFLISCLAALFFAACHKDEDKPEVKPWNPDEGKDTSTVDPPQPEPVPDGKMSVFLCFGQSNMEGNAAVEEQDRTGIPDNFKTMIVANCDVEHYGAKRYTWRKADPPLARFTTGLTPADYFGRKVASKLPSGERVGVVMVAIGGASIEAFEKETCEAYCNKSDHADWYKAYLKEYDNNPYKTLIDAAKEAQKSGVIKGILLHQGETNNTDPTWPERVKKIYDNIIADLGLNPQNCPLLAGEMLRQENGGICYGHNEVIAKLPDVLPNSYVISSEGCEGNGQDGFHFNAEGYRILGERYASKMLALMGIASDGEYVGFHVEGRFLKDMNGQIVNLHGFGQTYSPWFNEQGTKWNGEDVEGCLKYNQGLIRDIMDAGWEMTWMRLHMDPHWTVKQNSGYNGEAVAHLYFDETRFKKYLDEVFVPMTKFCINNYKMAVVMRPPGVCGDDALSYGDAYQKYLLAVWGIVSSHPYLKNNPYVMFELANEPVRFNGGDEKYSKYFQDVVDLIRTNCENVVWVPGLAYQQDYKAFANYPIKGKNVGYAVHCYPGWYGSPAQVSAEEFNTPLDGNEEKFRAGFAANVGCVASFAPIIITEMDWSPHEYNENHHVAWGSSTTSAFGEPFKRIADEYGNVSWMIFTSPHLLAKYKNHSSLDERSQKFLEDPEACPTAAYNWYKEYAGGEVSHGKVTGIEVSAPNAVMQGASVRINVKLKYEDGYKIATTDGLSFEIADAAVLKDLGEGRFSAETIGETTVKVTCGDFSEDVKISVVGLFDLATFNPSIYETGTFDLETRTFTTGQYGFAGWKYESPVDLSAYKYLVVEMEDCEALNSYEFSFRVFDSDNYWGGCATYKFEGNTTVKVELAKLAKDDGTKMDASHVYCAGFWSIGNVKAVIKEIRFEN